MSQPTVAAFFNTRKRAAIDPLSGEARNKVLVLDNPVVESKDNLTNSSLNSDHEETRFVYANQNNLTLKNADGNGTSDVTSSPDPVELGRRITRASRSIQRIGAVDLDEKTKALLRSAQPKLVSFVKKGNLSPKKRVHAAAVEKKPQAEPPKKMASPLKVEATVTAEFSPRSNINNVEKAAATKQGGTSRQLKLEKDKDSLTYDEIKAKLLSHPRLSELKETISKAKSSVEKFNRLEKKIDEKMAQLATPVSPNTAAKNLQKFSTLDVEVLLSPKKQLTSPTKCQRTPTKLGKSELRSPTTSKRLSALMSPIKEPTTSTTVVGGSPKKLPLYERYHALLEPGTPTLQLPYKYRTLLELFKCVDVVCGMFYNRKEQITFKKLKPAVQRMARKNFFESHLAQIQRLYPGAFLLSQEMTKNYGSATKHETYQLVIKPNVEEKKVEAKAKKAQDSDADFLQRIQNQPMNPHVMTVRYQHFHQLLVEKVKDAHHAFLMSLSPPLNIERSKLRRWHLDFDLESCPDIEQAELPQPPNVERFSSAKDILSTARNLFNCGTPMERALERLEEKKRQATAVSNIASLSLAPEPNEIKPNVAKNMTGIHSTNKCEIINADGHGPPVHANEVVSSVLKNVPKALLERIRAKQAAKALDQMTRRPSQDKEAMKYSRLPEIARHLRNIFVTERKNVLPLETPLVKLENSYRGKLTLQELEEHVRMIAQLVPSWLTLPEVRKVKYAKVAKDCDLATVISILEKKANEAAQ